jgi:hypothetical protein
LITKLAMSDYNAKNLSAKYKIQISFKLKLC